MKTGESAVEQQPRLHLRGNSTEPQPGFSRLKHSRQPESLCHTAPSSQRLCSGDQMDSLFCWSRRWRRNPEWKNVEPKTPPLDHTPPRCSRVQWMSKISQKFVHCRVNHCFFNTFDCLSLFVQWFVLFSVKMQLNRNDKSRIQNKTLNKMISITPWHNMIAYIAKHIKNNIKIIWYVTINTLK